MVISNMQVVVKGDKEVFLYSDRMRKRIPVEGAKAAWNLTQMGARFLRDQAVLSGIRSFRGKLLSPSGIEARKLAKYRYGIFMPYYGAMLDRMPTHYAPIRRGTIMHRWAQQRGIRDKRGKIPKYIKVSKHPFIEAGWRNLLNVLDVKLNRTANKIIRG